MLDLLVSITTIWFGAVFGGTACWIALCYGYDAVAFARRNVSLDDPASPPAVTHLAP